MIRHIKSRLRKFRKDDEGSIVAEAVIMFPTLFAATLATFVFFDAFRNQAINLKANYTIAESISREDVEVTNINMVNAWYLHRFLTSAPSLTQLRVSVISYDATAETHRVEWSVAKGGGTSYFDKPISQINLNASEIPMMPNNEILIVVQTSVDYEPRFSIGLEGFTFENTTYTRPRNNPNNLCYNHNGAPTGGICPIDS